MKHGLVVGVFESDQGLLRAAQAARKAGLPIHDAYTPFPVHGMDEALGLEPSRLSTVCFASGATGLILILLFQFWVSLFDWPMNIGGKSYNASPALIPIAFEITVLFAGMGTVAAFFHLRRLSPGKKPAFEDSRAVDDRFLLALRLGPEGAGSETLRRFLQERGALEVREVPERP